MLKIVAMFRRRGVNNSLLSQKQVNKCDHCLLSALCGLRP